MTDTELWKYLGLCVTTALGAYLGSYLKKKGENLATHEDIDKLVNQVSAVTAATKQIEARISNQTWQRERRAELQLKAIDAVNILTSQHVQNFIADSKFTPSLEWYSSFSVTSATVKALFDNATYAKFKKLEILIAPGLGSESGPTFAVWQFIEVRDDALKAMYGQVIG
jgi:hypothetical protein